MDQQTVKLSVLVSSWQKEILNLGHKSQGHKDSQVKNRYSTFNA